MREFCIFFFHFLEKKNTNCFLFFPRKSLQATHSKKIRYLTKKGPKKGTLCCFSELFEFSRCVFFFHFFEKKKQTVFFFPGKVCKPVTRKKSDIYKKKRSKKKYFTLFFGTFRIFSNFGSVFEGTIFFYFPGRVQLCAIFGKKRISQ